MTCNKKKAGNDEDERNLLEQSFEKNNAEDTVIVPSNTAKTKSHPIKQKSPRDVRQVDTSFSFTNLKDDSNDNIEQSLMAIAPFEVPAAGYDEFKDEDVSNEYKSTQFVLGADSQETYAQFVPGVNASLSMDKSQELLPETSVLAVVTELEVKEDDVEAQVHESLLESSDETSSQVQKELVQVGPTSTDVVSTDDGYSTNDGKDNEKVPHARRNRCFIITAFLLLMIGASIIIGFTFTKARRISDAAAGTCSLCADGTTPANLDEMSITESQTCSDFMSSKAFLDATDSECQQGQALAWMSCGCPTLPVISSEMPDASCSFCPDGTWPVGQGCTHYSAAVSLAGSSPFLTCQEAIAVVPNHCQCPNLDPVEQLSRLVRPISGEALEDSTSPQFQALEWIVNVDPAKLSVGHDSAQVIKQRYAVAVLYFAFGGKTWTEQYNFLSGDSVCLWNDDEAGIQCNDSDEITSIRLRKYGV